MPERPAERPPWWVADSEGTLHLVEGSGHTRPGSAMRTWTAHCGTVVGERDKHARCPVCARHAAEDGHDG